MRWSMLLVWRIRVAGIQTQRQLPQSAACSLDCLQLAPQGSDQASLFMFDHLMPWLQLHIDTCASLSCAAVVRRPQAPFRPQRFAPAAPPAAVTLSPHAPSALNP